MCQHGVATTDEQQQLSKQLQTQPQLGPQQLLLHSDASISADLAAKKVLQQLTDAQAVASAQILKL